MKARLMFVDREFRAAHERQAAEAELIQDLDLTSLWQMMAASDKVILEAVCVAMLEGVATVEQVHYRQAIYADCLAYPEVIRKLYALANEAITEQKKSWRGIGISSDSGEPLLRSSITELEMLLGFLRRLRDLVDQHGDVFVSDGFRRLCATVLTELDDDYFREVDDHLHRLRFRDGVLASAELGNQNQPVGFVLRAPSSRGGLFHRPALQKPSFYRTIEREDDGGHEALANLRNRIVSVAADALAQSCDHIGDFFMALRQEIAFYLGCLNLHDALVAHNLEVCIPNACPAGSLTLRARGLYDACLPLRGVENVVGNDLDADNRALIFVTGANQGGKSTFLRSLGLAHLMMSAGMPVAARSFEAAIVDGVWTHFARREDASMTRGKFDEELQRMSVVGSCIRPGGLLLCNESFSTTNEREASEIAADIIHAMIDVGVRVVFVTHLFELSSHFFQLEGDTALFLRAERQSDGTRPFQLAPGAPEATSYSEDLYRRTFVDNPGSTASSSSSK